MRDRAWNVSYCVQVADWTDFRLQCYFGSPLHHSTPRYCRNPPNSHLSPRSSKQVFSCPRFPRFIKTQNQILVIHIPYCLVMGMKEYLTIIIHHLFAVSHHNGSTSHETADLQSEWTASFAWLIWWVNPLQRWSRVHETHHMILQHVFQGYKCMLM